MAATEQEDDGNFPSELKDRLTAFDDSLGKVQSILQSLHDVPLSKLHEKMTPLEKARIDLLGVYAMNSLFWMYLNCKGENPKEHGVKQELDRVKKYMERVKEVQTKLEDAKNRPSVNKDASKRFVRSALWQAAHNKSKTAGAESSTSAHQEVAGPGSSTSSHQEVGEQEMSEVPVAGKRPAAGQAEDSSEGPKKKKKKKKKH